MTRTFSNRTQKTPKTDKAEEAQANPKVEQIQQSAQKTEKAEQTQKAEKAERVQKTQRKTEHDQKTEDQESSHSGKFSALGLSGQLQKILTAAGYEGPTPIQAQSIPTILTGVDVLGCAGTGTGKTAAFALPILHNICAHDRSTARGRGPRALVVAPTRELAAQIGSSFVKYAGRGGPRQLVVFGGASKFNQIRSLKQGIDILVATPGRLLDLMDCGVVDLSNIETFVLDEADRMLDMGFIHDMKEITRCLPENRQTLMFSATMPPAIARLASSIQNNPTRVNADPGPSTQKPIEQSVYRVDQGSKTSLLLHLLEKENINRMLVFTRTKHGANNLSEKIARAGFASEAIHGNKTQAAREKTLRRFRDGKLLVVVATDVAARGIDVKELSHVINFDVPNEAESYVHRIGRTGRAGASGIAISFCSRGERSYLRNIERLIRKEIAVSPWPAGLEMTRQTEEEAMPERRRPSHRPQRHQQYGRRGSPGSHCARDGHRSDGRRSDDRSRPEDGRSDGRRPKKGRARRSHAQGGRSARA